MLHSFFAYTVYIGAHSKYFIPLGAHDQQSGQRCGKHHPPESQIRDTNMAGEMVRYSNNSILQQAGQSMPAQANQSNQGVLCLLG